MQKNSFCWGSRRNMSSTGTFTQKKSAYTDYMGYMVENISGAEQPQQEQNAPEINFTFSPLRSADAELLFDDLGYAYILFSVRQRQTTYIGQTKNLSKRLQQHN